MTKIKVKDLAELKALVVAMFADNKADGLTDDQSRKAIERHLKANEYEDGEGAVLKIDLTAMTPSNATDGPAMIAKAVADALKPIVEAMGIETKGKRPGTVTVKEPWEKILDGSCKTWDFKNIGDFAIAVFNENHPVATKRQTDPRLELIGKASLAVKNGLYTKATPTTYASELVGADGGFLVPPEYREQIWVAVHDSYSILSLIDMTPTNRNSVNWNVDVNAPWDNTAGIQVNWRQQAATMSQSKPVFQNRQVILNEMYALVPATDEIISDAPMLNNYLSVKAPEKMGYWIDDAIFNGGGQGMPLGIHGHPATQVIAANATTSGYSITDLSNMYPHLLEGGKMTEPEGVWVMSPREYALLPTLGTGSNAGFPLALTNQTIAGRIILSALGLPIYKSQHVPGKDKSGSILLANFKGYTGFNKSEGFDFQSSIHLFFDSGATALRWRFRFGGEPALRAGIPSANDTGNTMSHFVELGGRNGN